MLNRSKKILFMLFGLILSVGIFAGCASGGSDAESASSETTEEAAAEKSTDTAKDTDKQAGDIQEVSVAYNPTLGNVLGFIAKEKGFDTEEGISLDFVEFSNTTDALTALRSDKVDVGVSWGTSAPLILITEDADFAIIGGHENGGMPVYAKEDFEYKGLESFEGKKVATVRLYTPDVVWRAAMQEKGYDLEKDVEIMEFKKPSEALEAVKSGKADIFVGTNSMYPQAMEAGLKVIANSSDFWTPTHVGCRVVVNNPWLAENEDVAKGFMKAYIKAEKVVKEDPEFAVQVQQKSTGVSEEYARAQVLETEQIFQADPLTDGIIYNYDKLLELGFIENDNIDFKAHLIVKYYQEALAELQEENPDDEYYKELQKIFEENNSQMLAAQ